MVFGWCIYVVGLNLEVMWLLGVDIDCVKFVIFVLMGLMCVFVGFVNMVWLVVGLLFVGMMGEFDVIVVCFIGGMLMCGGLGIVYGVLIGVFVMVSFDNGMLMLDVDVYW